MKFAIAICMLVLCAGAPTRGATLPAPLAPVGQPARQITPPPPVLDQVNITLVVNLKLNKLSPLANTAKLSCYAVAGSLDVLSGEASQLAATWNLNNPILSNAHYYGAIKTTAPQPIANGSYQGAQTVTLIIPRNGLIDVRTHALYDNPGVAVGCILVIDNAVAKYDPAPQLPNASNVNVVSTEHPWIVLTQAIQNMQ